MTLIESRDLDYDIYNAKFVKWDNFVREGKEHTNEALTLLKDPTIYAYALFKDKDNKPFKLTAYQDVISNVAVRYNFNPFDPSRHILFRAANQIGKSGDLCINAIYHFLNGVNETIVIVSNNLTNSQRVLREIKFLLNTSRFESWKENVGDSDNTTMLSIEGEGGKFVNRIICAPSGEGLLGYPVTRLYLDELDFYEEAKNFFWKVAYPRLNKTKGQVIVFSNPNPDINKTESILWELESGDLFAYKFHFTFLDAPWGSQREYEVAKRNSPSHLFASTHDGEYSDLAGSFFKDAEIKDMLRKDWDNNLPIVNTQVYIGVDLGKMNDNTVITIGVASDPVNKFDKYKDLDVRYVEVLPLGTEYDKIAMRMEELKEYYDRNFYGVARIGFDATGQKTFGDFLKKRNIYAFEVDFSKKETNKTLLYNDFKLMAEQRKIKIVYTVLVEKQLGGLRFKQTENKQLKKDEGLRTEKHRRIENSSDSIHDDIPSACAILIHIAVRPSKIPVTMQYVEEPDAEVKNTSAKLNEEDISNKAYDNYMAKTIFENRKPDRFDTEMQWGGFI